jgi:archaellum biogenesis ATPase FlaH
MHSYPCLEAALKFRERGWSTIPLCPFDHSNVSPKHQNSCKRPGKSALCPWTTFQCRLPSISEIKMLFKRNKKSNVGVIFGQVSKIVGLDIDGPEASDILKKISKGKIPPTTHFATPNGKRLIYSLPPDVKIPRKRFQQDTSHLLVLGEGSYTVMPPSIHLSGKAYGELQGELVLAPDWLLSLAVPVGDEQGQAGGEVSPGDQEKNRIRAIAYLNKCHPCIQGQDGSGKATLIAARLIHGFHLSVEDAFCLVMEHYNDKCQPPWSDKEWMHKLDWVKQKGYGKDMGPSTNGAITKTTVPKGTNHFRMGCGITKKPIQWLWPGWIPLAKLTVLDGDPGLGKSTLLLDLAARVTKLGKMPDNVEGMSGNVCVMSAEDSAEDTMIPRLEAAKYTSTRTFFLEEVEEPGGERRPYEFPEDLEKLEEFLFDKNIRLLIIDPLIAFIVGADVNKDQEIRRVLFKLSKIADRTKTAIIGMRHLNKSNNPKALYRGNMSIGVIGHARTGLLVAQDPDEEELRVFCVTKCNLAKRPQPLSFRLEQATPDICRIQWLGPCSHDPDTLLNPPKSEEEKEKSEEAKSQLQECMDIIHDLLELNENKVKVNEAKAECKKALGASPSTVQRAARKLHLEKGYAMEGTKRVYYWTLNSLTT